MTAACLCPDPRNPFYTLFPVLNCSTLPRANASLRSETNDELGIWHASWSARTIEHHGRFAGRVLRVDWRSVGKFSVSRTTGLHLADNTVVITVSHLRITLVCSKGIHPKTRSIRVFSSQGCALSVRFLG